MSYEEKYKEALKRADSLTEKYGGREFAEYVFPELAESEDERIRKKIIENVRLSGGYTDEEIDEMISWLEKQKEQKVDIDKLRRDLYQSGYNDGYQHGKEDAQKEQKPAEWSDYKDKVNIPYCSSEPEWSEELKNELAKKHLDGYIKGREDTMREMSDFMESHFNCENAKKGTPIVYNTQSGTSTSKAEEEK